MSIFSRSISDADPVFRNINDFADHALNEIRDTWPSFLPSVSGSDLLWERIVELDSKPDVGISFNRSCRIIQARDGLLAFNLAREEDWSLLPALLEIESSCQSWGELEISVKRKARRPLLERARLMGLPVSIPGDEDVLGIWLDELFTSDTGLSAYGDLKILDFSSLWAGPLCSHLLLNLGCKVSKIESKDRRDFSGDATPRLSSVLNKDKELFVVDFRDKGELDSLRQIMREADVVIEGSRPRAFKSLGIDRNSIKSLQTETQYQRQLWVSLTAYGRFDRAADWVGFGDDVAACAGLLDRTSSTDYRFVGDAIADPLAGLLSALTITRCFSQNLRGLIDFSLFRAARVALGAVNRPDDTSLAPLKKVRSRC